jgi:hypothetical protein
MQRNCRTTFIACLGLVLAATVAAAEEPERHEGRSAAIKPGADFFQTATSQPTSVDFSAHPIPAGFFCAASKAFTGKIELKGVPLVTEPAGAAGQSDTVVQHSKAVWTGGAAKMRVRVRALHLTGTQPVTIDCAGTATQWQVDVTACGGQPQTAIVAKADEACGCGHFDGRLTIRTRVKFTEVGATKVAGPIPQNVTLKITGMPWCPRPAPNQLIVPSPIKVDTACAGKPVWVEVPGTSDFFPGFDCANLTKDCWTIFASLTHCHKGPTPDHPHCINPVCGRQK